MAGAAVCVPICWPDPCFCRLGHWRPPLQGFLFYLFIWLRGFFFYYHYFYFLFFFSRASSPEFYCGPDLSAGAEKPRGAVPSRAEPPAPGPARGSASLAQSRPRVGRGAAEWRAPRRRLPAEQPGAAAAPRPGRGGSRAGGGGSEKAREDPPAPRGEEKEERREGAWM